MTERKKYSKEFKLDAVSLVTGQNYNRAEAARSPGINANMLGRWIKETESDDGLAFRGNGKLTPDQEKIRKLKTHITSDKELLYLMSITLSAGIPLASIFVRLMFPLQSKPVIKRVILAT